MLESVVKNCTFWRQLILYFNLKETGGNYSNLQNRCKEFKIDTSHFTGQRWNQYGHPNFGNNIDVTKVLVLRDLQILCSNCHSQTDSYCKRQKIRKSTKSININIDEGLSTQKETSDVNVG